MSCTLYIANSTIPRAGLGIFTSVPREYGEVIDRGDVSVPLIDLPDYYPDSDVPGPFLDYVWEGSTLGMHAEASTSDRIFAFSPGTDAAVNANPYLNNIGRGIPQRDETASLTNKVPSVGSFSPYFGGVTKATRYIPASTELFKDYGDEWFASREDELGPVPSQSECHRIDTLLYSFISLPSYTQQLVFHFMEDMRSVWPAFRALPSTFDDAVTAGKHGLHVLHQKHSQRTPEWLDKHGKCVDSIVAKNSTIPNAGRGAFAKHAMSKGSIVIASPLVHVVDREYIMIQDTDDTQRKPQLVLNYCFGHRQSTLLLCPYGSGVNLINHSQERSNIQIRWAKHGTTAHDNSMFSMSIQEMMLVPQPKLAFDYVATRDIEAGEELFMDYGGEWDRAWKQHIESWTPDPIWSQYRDPQEYDRATPTLRSTVELVDDPYPPNLETRCHASILYSVQPSDAVWEQVVDGATVIREGLPCNILRRFAEGQTYGVSLQVQLQEEEDDMITSQWIPIADVPREAIRFFETATASDMNLPQSFRHEIMIADDMFPSAWMNKAL